MKNFKTMQNGRSMIEMLGVLAVIGVLSVGGLSLVSKMNTSRKVAAVMDEIGALAVKTRTVMRDYEGNAGDVTEYIQTSRAYPMELKYANNTFSGTDDAQYKVSYVGSGSVLYEIEASGLTNEMCLQATNTNWGTASTSGFISLKVTKKNETTPTELTENAGLGEIADLCEGEGITVTFSYR